MRNHPIARFAAVSVALVAFAGCASGSRTTPVVSISQRSAANDIEVRSESGVPIEFRLSIDNPLDQPVTLIAVEVETVGSSGGYQLNRVRHDFTRVIAAKSSDTVDFRAWVQPLSRDQSGDVSSPVLLRGTARFETEAGQIRTNFTSRGQ